MVRCPHCGYEGSEEGFKLLKEPWRYGYYTVKLFECPSCRRRFRYYVGTLPSGRVSEFYIPKAKTEEVEAKQEERTIPNHAIAVKMMREIGELLGFHVTVEEVSVDRVINMTASGGMPLSMDRLRCLRLSLEVMLIRR